MTRPARKDYMLNQLPMDDPARVAFLGDVHMGMRWTLDAIAWARRWGAQAIVQVGDFGYTFADAFLDPVTKAAEKASLHLVFVDGNHEDHTLLGTGGSADGNMRSLRPRIHHAGRGYRWTWNGVRFLALGGAHSVDRPWRLARGQMWHPQETITAEQAEFAAAGGRCDVLVSHDCPAGVTIPGLRPDGWEPEQLELADRHRGVLRTVVDRVQPRYIYHGHYHLYHQQNVDLGYGPVKITGLSCDGTSRLESMTFVDLVNGEVRADRDTAYARPKID